MKFIKKKKKRKHENLVYNENFLRSLIYVSLTIFASTKENRAISRKLKKKLQSIVNIF